jgi:hypothetical protein
MELSRRVLLWMQRSAQATAVEASVVASREHAEAKRTKNKHVMYRQNRNYTERYSNGNIFKRKKC